MGGAYGAQWVGDHDIGLGVNAIAWKGPYCITGGFQDGHDGDNSNYPDFGSFSKGQFVYLAEMGMGRDPSGPDEFSARVTASHLDLDDGSNPDKGSGESLIVSLLKRHASQWAVAGRWSKSFGRLSSDYRELGSLSFMWLEPFSRPRDLLGVGAFVGDPSDSSKGSEKGLDVFYRIQLTQALNITADIQYWNRRDAGDGTTNTWIYGIRGLFAF